MGLFSQLYYPRFSDFPRKNNKPLKRFRFESTFNPGVNEGPVWEEAVCSEAYKGIWAAEKGKNRSTAIAQDFPLLPYKQRQINSYPPSHSPKVLHKRQGSIGPLLKL